MSGVGVRILVKCTMGKKYLMNLTFSHRRDKFCLTVAHVKMKFVGGGLTSVNCHLNSVFKLPKSEVIVRYLHGLHLVSQ